MVALKVARPSAQTFDFHSTIWVEFSC